MKSLISEENRKEIFYNVINSLLSGLLVFFGSLTSGNITIQGVLFALGTSGAVFIAKFKEYWETEKKDYCKGLFNFI